MIGKVFVIGVVLAVYAGQAPTAAGVQEGCVDCTSFGCLDGYHKMTNLGFGLNRNWHQDCAQPAGCSGHPDCISGLTVAGKTVPVLGAAGLDRLWVAIESEQWAEVDDVARRFPHQVTYNSSARAIQVFGCSGKLIASAEILSPNKLALAE